MGDLSSSAARSKREREDEVPRQVAMRPRGVTRQPSTDQKKVRRAMTRGERRTASTIEEFPMSDIQREATLLAAMAKATPAEQRQILADLDALREERTQSVAASRESLWGAEIAAAHLTPIPTHVRATAATDWLGDVSVAPEGDVTLAMKTEASRWFSRTSAEVRADREEFAIQADGAAHLAAGPHGEAYAPAKRAFLDHVAHLHRTARVVTAKPVVASDAEWEAGYAAGLAGEPRDRTQSFDWQDGWLVGDSSAKTSGDYEDVMRSAYSARVTADSDNGHAESTVTDYETKADQEPYLAEDWTPDADTGVHPSIPGAGGQTPPGETPTSEEADPSDDRAATAARRTAAGEKFRVRQEPGSGKYQAQIFSNGVWGDLGDPVATMEEANAKIQERSGVDGGRTSSRRTAAVWADDPTTGPGWVEADVNGWIVAAGPLYDNSGYAWTADSSNFSTDVAGSGKADSLDAAKSAAESWAQGHTASRKTAVVSEGDVVEFAGETRTVKSVEDRGEKPGQDRYRIVFEDGLTTTHPSGNLRSASRKTADWDAMDLASAPYDAGYEAGWADAKAGKPKAVTGAPATLGEQGYQYGYADALANPTMASRRTADSQNGNAESRLPQVEVSTADNSSKFPWEIEKDAPMEGDEGEGAADVAGTHTPGQSVADYPQPKTSTVGERWTGNGDGKWYVFTSAQGYPALKVAGPFETMDEADEAKRARPADPREFVGADDAGDQRSETEKMSSRKAADLTPYGETAVLDPYSVYKVRAHGYDDEGYPEGYTGGGTTLADAREQAQEAVANGWESVEIVSDNGLVVEKVASRRVARGTAGPVNPVSAAFRQRVQASLAVESALSTVAATIPASDLQKGDTFLLVDSTFGDEWVEVTNISRTDRDLLVTVYGEMGGGLIPLLPTDTVQVQR